MSPPRPRILILGAHGGLGRALVRHLGPNFEVTAWTRADLDLMDLEAIPARLATQPFDILLNPAGLTSPDACEEKPGEAWRTNCDAPQYLARVCQQRKARLIHFSTDHVFDGESQTHWSEEDPAGPVNLYGRSKLNGEHLVLAECPNALILRVSWLFGPDKPGHPDQMIARALQSADISAVANKTSVPTSTADLCGWIEQLINHHPDVSGILHLCNSGSTSWHGWAQAALEIAASLGLPVQTTHVTPASLSSLTFFKAARPAHTAMRNGRFTQITGISPRDWRSALADYLQLKHGHA